MSASLDGSADQQLASYIDRILALHAKADAKQLEVRAVYAKIKAAGFDKTSVGKIVGYLRLPAGERERIDRDTSLSVAMPLREWTCDLSSSPALHALLSRERS